MKDLNERIKELIRDWLNVETAEAIEARLREWAETLEQKKEEV
ncbi:MAG: hypothetical protein QW786_03930 [Candidatus Hadarchaeum sp.]